MSSPVEHQAKPWKSKMGIWRFPKMGVTSKSSRIGYYMLLSMGKAMVWGSRILGNLRMMMV